MTALGGAFQYRILEKYGREGYSTEALKDLYLKLNNDALVDLPEHLALSIHVSRGNYHSTGATSGGYEPVVEHIFGRGKVDFFFLEFDDERSRDFSPLRFVPKDKKVVLGVVTSKKTQLEDKEVLKARIKEASQYVDLSRLSLSLQCGFASTEKGNILSEQEQWSRLRLVKEVTKEV